MSRSIDPSDPVLVIGACGLDVVARLQNDLQEAVSNPARIRNSYGGVGRNVAENLARLGQPVNLLSVVGNDSIGRDALAFTQSAGVDVSGVLTSERCPTGFYMGVLNEDGSRKFAFDDMRALEDLSEDFLSYNEVLFEKAGMIFLDANLPEKSLHKAFALARKYKVPVCADPTSRSLARRLIPYLEQIHMIVPNYIESSVFTGTSFAANDIQAAEQAARALINLGVDIAFVTLSEYGICYATSETIGHVPAIRTRVIDPIGAGDALTAAVIFAMMNNIEIDDAARLGVSASSLALRHTGTVNPELTLERLYDELSI